MSRSADQLGNLTQLHNETGERGSCRARLSSGLVLTVIEDVHLSRQVGQRCGGRVQNGALTLISTVRLDVAAKSRSAEPRSPVKNTRLFQKPVF